MNWHHSEKSVALGLGQSIETLGDSSEVLRRDPWSSLQLKTFFCRCFGDDDVVYIGVLRDFLCQARILHIVVEVIFYSTGEKKGRAIVSEGHTCEPVDNYVRRDYGLLDVAKP